MVVYLTELDAALTVSAGVEWRGPDTHAHHIGYHQQDDPGYTRLGREAYLHIQYKLDYPNNVGDTQLVEIIEGFG